MHLAPYIDHTILRPDTSIEEVVKICQEAKQYGFAAVCVPPNFVAQAVQTLKDCSVKVATVVGFPFGYSNASAKKAECIAAIADGVEEIDMVANIIDIKALNEEKISKEWSEILQVVRLHNKCLKIIIESGILKEEEIKFCCHLANKHKIDFLKTSTGYASVGATVDAVKLMRANLHPDIQIKASGGIRNAETAIAMIKAGATRIGASASLQIIGID